MESATVGALRESTRPRCGTSADKTSVLKLKCGSAWRETKKKVSRSESCDGRFSYSGQTVGGLWCNYWGVVRLASLHSIQGIKQCQANTYL